MRSWASIDAQPMFGMQAYLVGGKMFAAVGEHGLLVKLPKRVRDPLIAARQAEVTPMGGAAAFGEWVTLTTSTVDRDPAAALALVRQSFEYVVSAPHADPPPREERRFRKRQF